MTKIPDTAKAKTLKAFLHWMLNDGQKIAPPLAYAPLPKGGREGDQADRSDSVVEVTLFAGTASQRDAV